MCGMCSVVMVTDPALQLKELTQQQTLHTSTFLVYFISPVLFDNYMIHIKHTDYLNASALLMMVMRRRRMNAAPAMARQKPKTIYTIFTISHL